MATWRINSGAASQWVASYDYSVGDYVVCRVAYGTQAARAFVYECTTDAGSSNSTEPTWPLSATSTVVDDGITWTCRSPDDGNWDHASPILNYVLSNAAVSAGDTVYIHDAHAENTDLSTTYYIDGQTFSNPLKIYCVDKDNSDALSTGAVVENAAAAHPTRIQESGYSYGVCYRSLYNIELYGSMDGWWTFEGGGTTVLHLDNAVASGRYIRVPYSANYQHVLEIIDGDVQFANYLHYFSIIGAGLLIWRGGSLIASVGTNYLIGDTTGYTTRTAVIRDVDLSAAGDGATARALVRVDVANMLNITFSRCKLPDVSTDTAFTITTGTWHSAKNGKVRCHHCSSGNSVIGLAERSYEGAVDDETSIYLDATTGTEPFSFKMVSSSGCKEMLVELRSPPISGWTTETTSTTYSIECVWDSATAIQDDEIYMELEYPADAASGLGAIEMDKCVLLGTPANQTSSSVSWTGTGGFSNESKFKLSVTVTPGKAGPITARVYLGKASTTVYIDPIITES